MDIRITQQFSNNIAIRQAQMRQQQIAELQKDLATGLRIHQPSDAPNEWGYLVGQKSSSNRMEVDLENIATARQRLNQSVSSLTEAGNILTRARELAIAGPQSLERETLASEVDRLIDAMLAIGNSSVAGVQQYAGTASSTIPFEVTGEDESGRPTSIEYRGSNDSSDVVVSPGITASALPSGAEVFQQSKRTPSVYVGPTGAKAGLGTDSAAGIGELIVKHTATTYGSGSVAPGASSVGGDTIIGEMGVNTLTILADGSGDRFVRLNGGERFEFDASSTDLRVVGPDGERVFVDLSGLLPSFSGDIDLEATGTVSVDGGITETVIDFTNNQVLTNDATGEVTVIDSASIRRPGTDRIEYSGTDGVFESLMRLRDDLRQADDLPSPQLQTILDARIADIQRAHDQVTEFVGEQAVELSNIEVLENRVRELKLVTDEAVIELENADVADAIVKLQTEQNHLQFIYATTAMITQNSLLDFIR